MRGVGAADRRQRDHFADEGIGGRTDRLQAAAVRVRLPHLEAAQQVRLRFAAPLPGFAPTGPGDIGATTRRLDGDLFVITSHERDRVAAELAACGVETQVHYRRPLHPRPAGGGGALPVAERRAGEVLSLPFHAALTDAEQDIVIEALAESFR